MHVESHNHRGRPYTSHVWTGVKNRGDDSFGPDEDYGSAQELFVVVMEHFICRTRRRCLGYKKKIDREERERLAVRGYSGQKRKRDETVPTRACHMKIGLTIYFRD